MVKAKKEGPFSGRVPNVRQARPGVPWGVHGRKTMGRGPSNASATWAQKVAAKIMNPRTWSESIRRIRFRPMYASANMGHPSRTSKFG
jgi:hypothetical protein